MQRHGTVPRDVDLAETVVPGGQVEKKKVIVGFEVGTLGISQFVGGV